MPRTMRQRSQTGIYHVILRGINRQAIFNEADDYQKFIEIMLKCKAISGFEMFAYCLMQNHVHLLIKENQEGIAQIFKRIGVRYVSWYNWKYDRRGPLFQDRFKSEPIEDDRYLLAVLRYIHQNPMKAKIANQLEDYPYSSYRAYIIDKQDALVDKGLILQMMYVDQFIEYHQRITEEKVMEYAEESRITDAEGKALMAKISGCSNAEEFLKLDEKKREEYIREIRSKGMSIRQISRLTGVSIGVIRRI